MMGEAVPGRVGSKPGSHRSCLVLDGARMGPCGSACLAQPAHTQLWDFPDEAVNPSPFGKPDDPLTHLAGRPAPRLGWEIFSSTGSSSSRTRSFWIRLGGHSGVPLVPEPVPADARLLFLLSPGALSQTPDHMGTIKFSAEKGGTCTVCF